MAQSGYTPILIYASGTAAALPSAANLTSSANGAELALNYADGKLYYKNSSGVVTLLASAAAASGTPPGGSTTQVQYNNAGAFAGSANLTFDGTTLTANGNTVITSSGATDALRITQTGSGNALLVEDSANPDATPFVVDASGVVGIGTTTPITGVSLTLVPSAGEAVVAYKNADDTGGAVLRFRKSRGTFASPTVVQSGDTTGTTIFQGYDGANYLQTANISSAVDGTPGTNDMPGRLVFSTTADGASSATERMRITSAGNVLVGRTYTGNEKIGIGGPTNTYSTATSASSIFDDTTVSSAQTNAFTSFSTYISTQAASFTLANLTHYKASQFTIGAGSIVTNQYGFFVDSSLTGATNNYGFYSSIASGTNRWNFYANGTASNFFGGNTIISVADNTNAALRITQTGTGDAILVEDSANPDSSPFVVDANGRTVVGYTAPITGPGANTSALQTHSTSVFSMGFGGTYWAADATGVSAYLAKSRGSSIGTRSIVSNGDSVGRFLFSGDDGTSFISAAAIEAFVDGTPGTNDMPGRLAFYTTADGASFPTERMRIDSAGNVGIGLTPVANNGILQLGSYGSVKALMETATVSATAATGTINYDAATQAVVYYTSNASANWTVNFRGSASLSLNSMMQTGQSLTLAFLVTQGATAYYNSAVQVDGASVTPKWQGGTAPTSGNASSIDIYSYTIVKTGSAAFTVFASQTKFA